MYFIPHVRMLFRPRLYPVQPGNLEAHSGAAPNRPSPQTESPKQLTTLSPFVDSFTSPFPRTRPGPVRPLACVPPIPAFSQRTTLEIPTLNTPVIRECFVLPQPLLRAPESRCHRKHVFVPPLNACILEMKRPDLTSDSIRAPH